MADKPSTLQARMADTQFEIVGEVELDPELVDAFVDRMRGITPTTTAAAPPPATAHG